MDKWADQFAAAAGVLAYHWITGGAVPGGEVAIFFAIAMVLSFMAMRDAE